MKSLKVFCFIVTACFAMTCCGIAYSFDLASLGAFSSGGSGFPKGRFIVEPDRSDTEMAKRIQGETDFEKIRNLSSRDKDLDIARRVGYFDIGSSCCSGFLVGPDLFLSNHHCVYDEVNNRMRPVGDYTIHMDYLDDNSKGRISSNVKELLAEDEHLDYALLRLEKPLGSRLGWLQLGGESKGKNSAVKIFQHPQGRSKEVSRKHSKIVRETDTVLHYMADTEGGSSGSPVFSLDGSTVIALHHVGTNKYNEGVLMKRILPHIQQWLWPGSSSSAPSTNNRLTSTGTPQGAQVDDSNDHVMQTINDLLNSQ